LERAETALFFCARRFWSTEAKAEGKKQKKQILDGAMEKRMKNSGGASKNIFKVR
jgi:hypothetical protein